MDLQLGIEELSSVTVSPHGFVFSDGTGNTVEIHADADERRAWLRMLADQVGCTVEFRDLGPSGDWWSRYPSSALAASHADYEPFFDPSTGRGLDPRDPTAAALFGMVHDDRTRLTSDGLR